MIASMFEAAQRFHAQPLNWKLRLRINEHNIGYMDMGACLPNCQTADNPAKYPPITYGDYAIWFATRNYEHQNHAATSETIDA